ncbi:uncharacterized protein H6S33_002362 [Morchella sextelata]|uniref:uncharacterized protein n=1 Tax=Morchella sextelata TaxID=1174677 RepID=UPI001D058E7C|nr:uncharacterized protein H6S33_002362 [Morchella sextelata]KAH0608310.1 hypothetical protein H6S33_002362 [Morchella sextelata]
MEQNLTPLQQSVQRVFGSAYAALSVDDINQNLSIETGESITVSSCSPQHHQSPVIVNTQSSSRRPRCTITEGEKVVLMHLYVDYQVKHVQGKKSAFWLLISELLEQESGGVKLKDPQKTVSLIVARRRAEVRMQERESGTVQRENELTQKIDAWIAHEDQLERMVSDTAKGNSALAKETEEAAVHRRNVLVRLGEKRNRDGELDSDREESDETVAKEVRKMRKNRRPVISSERSADTLAVVGAVESLGSGMVTAVRELVASRQPQVQQNERIDRKFQELREQLAREREEDRITIERQRNEDRLVEEARSTDFLSHILGKLDELKKL